jgi:5-amino-6-(5-phosphoribosylamino)uracil reductase
VEERPYTLLSCSVSLDGYLDSPTMPRLPLSNAADFERIDAVRASCDAILVGANTIRRDNPRLLIRSEDRRRQREQHGLPASPVKVTVTETGDLDPGGQFFTAGTADKIVYCPTATRRTLDTTVGCSATVVGLGTQVTVRAIAEDLAARGVRRLMIEGGATVPGDGFRACINGPRPRWLPCCPSAPGRLGAGGHSRARPGAAART